MKKVRLLIAATVSASLVIAVIAAPAQAGSRIPSTVPYFGLILDESFDLNLEPDAFFANSKDPIGKNIVLCAGPEDELCTKTTDVMIIHNLPVCSVDSSFDCIKSVWAVDPSGKKIEGTYQRSLPANTRGDHEPYPSMMISAGRGLGGLWQIPGVTNGGGTDNYFVSLRINSGATKAAGTPLLSQKMYYGQVMAGIIPVKEISGNYKATLSQPTWAGGGEPGTAGPSYTPEGVRCTVTDVGICQSPQNFPEGYRFGMSVQFAQKLSGWFHGRIALPLVSQTKIDKGQLVEIEAEPVKVSTLDFTIPNAEIPESVRKLIFADRDWGVSGDSKGGIKTMLEGLSNPVTMEIMNAMLPTIGDKATKTTQYWSFRALNSWKNPEVQRCSEQQGVLGGVITTNALTYGDGPPIFNKATGALEYKIASPHLQADGELALGTYDLAVKSDVARCIYGFSNAPIQASISIINESGEQKIATTIVNERGGWLYLSAKGFTFSSPTISVKLSQATAQATAKTAAKKVTLVCMKGKLLKKVTGTKPKCPAGYKAR